jgi:type IV pilus assembly protein PilC
MQRDPIFPVMLGSMVEVGEETGQLPEMLNQIADGYDEDLDNAVGSITSIIEPILIVFLAVVVGFIVIALFLPIIEIMQNMGG